MPVSRALFILPGLIAVFAGPAGAEGTRAEIGYRSGAALLAHEDGLLPDASWLSVQLDRVHLKKKHGFAYTHAIDRGERGLELSVQGPAVGTKKAVGLGFELRF